MICFIFIIVWLIVVVDGVYVDEGWVDKICKYCKKDMKGVFWIKDLSGCYVYVVCVENVFKGNFFLRFFG